VFFQAQEEAKGGVGVASDQDGLGALENLVECSNADWGKVVAVVVSNGSRDSGANNVVDGAQRDGIVKEVSEQFDDAAEGTVADEDEGEDELVDPGFGDREVEEDAFLGGLGLCEGE
jgi:hypothetical protein